VDNINNNIALTGKYHDNNFHKNWDYIDVNDQLIWTTSLISTFSFHIFKNQTAQTFLYFYIVYYYTSNS